MASPQYGAEHQKIRAHLIRNLVDGDLCDRCWQPMHRGQRLEAAHPHDRPVSKHPDSKADHLEHEPCNRRAGNHLHTPGVTTRLRTTRDW